MTFLDKSNQNRSAGDILTKQSLYASSVSRYYYCYLQFLFYILSTKLVHKKEELEQFRKENEGSHQFAYRIIDLEMIHRRSKDYKWFQSKNKELKLLRVKADYKEEPIILDNASNASLLANALINCLKENFK